MERPTSEDYQTFLYEFSNGLKSIDRISLFLYGSSLRTDFVPGVSDINGFIVLNDSFVTDKNLIVKLATSLESALKQSNTRIRTRFDVLDRGIAQDGRFLCYSKDYVDFFKKNAARLFGEYNLKDMNGFDFRSSELCAIASNIGKIRRGILYNNLRHYSERRDFYEDDIKILNRTFQLPKQLINLAKSKLPESKEDAIKKFSREFSDYKIDNFVFNRVQALMNDGKEYDSFFEESGCFSFSLKCLTEMEEMIKVYVAKFPEVMEYELKDEIKV